MHQIQFRLGTSYTVFLSRDLPVRVQKVQKNSSITVKIILLSKLTSERTDRSQYKHHLLGELYAPVRCYVFYFCHLLRFFHVFKNQKSLANGIDNNGNEYVSNLINCVFNFSCLILGMSGICIQPYIIADVFK